MCLKCNEFDVVLTYMFLTIHTLGSAKYENSTLCIAPPETISNQYHFFKSENHLKRFTLILEIIHFTTLFSQEFV